MPTYHHKAITFAGRVNMFKLDIEMDRADLDPESPTWEKEWSGLFMGTDIAAWLVKKEARWWLVFNRGFDVWLVIADDADALQFKATWGAVHPEPVTITF